MAGSILRWADRRTEPWANGAGVTHPLARGNARESWRVSIAEIAASSPFSRLPGIHRQFVCLGPAPIVLSVDDRPRDVAVGDITTFSGDSNVRCQVDQPSLALNVMSRIGTPAPNVQLIELQAGVSETLRYARRGLLVVLTGTVQMTTPGASGTLARLDAMDFRGTGAQLEGLGRAVLVVP